MKKIIISSNILWTITQFRIGLIAYLKNNNFDIVCLADNDNFSSISELKIINLNARFVKVPISRKGMNPIQDIKYFISLLKIFKIEKPDIIINYTIKPVIYGSVAAYILKIPSFAVITGLGFVFIRNSILAKFVRLSYKVCLRLPQRVFFLNKDDYDLFLDYKLINNTKCVIIPGEGIDTSYYTHNTNIKTENFKFLLVARLLWDKGIGEYVEAIKMLQLNINMKNVEYQLLGHIDEDNPSGIDKLLIHSWHESKIIYYLGTVEDAREIMNNADCVVLPSYREGVPRTLLEAASMEKPIIATNCAGCKDVVDDRINGFLCEVGDPQDLAEKMLKMYQLSEEERFFMGKRGREKMIQQFEDKIVFEIYLRALNEVLISKT